jgi:hypothetical protein
MNDFKTCKHSYDTGGTCNSAAVTGRDYCGSHLRYRARQLRIAQVRARNQRFDLKLPPIESMATVFSALNQIVEAVAADMIDLKRADFLLKTLRFAAQALKNSDKWQPSVFHTDVAAPAINLESEYGLPDTLDLNTPPEVAFPPLADAEPSDLAASPTGNWPLTTGNSLDSPMPTVDYCEHGPGCPEHTIRADYPETAELAELREVYQTQGVDAMGACHKRQQHNRQRRSMNTARKRYAAIALERNLRLAAEKLAERKLAAQQAVAQNASPASDAAGKKPHAAAGEAFAAEGFAAKKEEAID